MAIKKFTKELPGDMVGQKTTAVPMSNLAEAEWVTPVHISSLTGTLPVDVTFPDSMNVVDSIARTSLAAIDTKLGATLNVSDASARTTLTSINTALAGTIKTSVQNWPATQAVSGSVSITGTPSVSVSNFPSTQAVSDSTARTSLAAIDTKLGGTLSVSSSTLLTELTNVKTEVQNVKAQLQTTLSTKVVESTIMQPVEVQGKYMTTIQTHANVSIDTNSWVGNASWIDTNGYSEVALTFLNDAATASAIAIEWSNNGSVKHGGETILSNSTAKERAASTSTKARYLKVSIQNADTATHIVNAWIYLKA